MNKPSAIQFPTESRIHMGLAVRNLEQSIHFYMTLFGQPPTKTRPNYAKFEVFEPPVNLSINEVAGETAPPNPVTHFGIQLKSTDAVDRIAKRWRQSGLETTPEENVDCCYAVQDKMWVTDPDGNKWEVYVVLDDNGRNHASASGECCPNVPSILKAVEKGDLSKAQTELREAGGSNACC